MIECEKCGARIVDDSRFCNYCGLPVQAARATADPIEVEGLAELNGLRQDSRSSSMTADEDPELREMLHKDRTVSAAPPIQPAPVRRKHQPWWKEILVFRHRSRKPAYIVARDIGLAVIGAAVLGIIIFRIMGG